MTAVSIAGEVDVPVEEHNRFAGQGSVLLDIGGNIGALIVHAPAEMAGVEIEIRPAGTGSTVDHEQDHHREHARDHSHAHEHDHDHAAEHAHEHAHGHHNTDHAHSHHPHVAVVARPTANGPAHTAVFGELLEGSYELYRKLGGPVELTATVIGAEVVELTWPA